MFHPIEVQLERREQHRIIFVLGHYRYIWIKYWYYHYNWLLSLLMGASGSNYSIFLTFLAFKKKLLYSFKNWNSSHPINSTNPLTAYRCIRLAILKPLFYIFVSFLSNFYFVLSLNKLLKKPILIVYYFYLWSIIWLLIIHIISYIHIHIFIYSYTITII